MTTKNLVILGGAAVLLVAAAMCSSTKTKEPQLNGRSVLPGLDLSAISRIEAGNGLAVASTDDGWVVESMQGYPADVTKIRRNLLKLQELKIGQTVRGREPGVKTSVALKDAGGETVAGLTLGDKHVKWGHGRYADYKGTTVLVSDTLDAFDGDAMSWVDAKIIDKPYITFKSLADQKLTEEEMGFTTGVVVTVTIAGDTNRNVTVGAAVKEGSDRYLKVDGSKWTYVISSHAADNILPKPPEPPAEPEETPVVVEEQPAAEPEETPDAT